MLQNDFSIVRSMFGRDKILTPSGTLIAVYKLRYESFKTSRGQQAYFADNNGELLGFKVDAENSDPAEIAEALKWYSNFINNPGMLLQLNDPRQLVN